MKVSEIMKKKFLYFMPESTVYETVKKLRAENREEAPVLADGKFRGMVNLSRLALAMKRKHFLNGKQSMSASLKMRAERIGPYVITIPIFTKVYLEPNMELSTALSIFSNRPNAECAAVLDKKKRVVGVVHAPELSKAMLELLEFGMGGFAKKDPIKEKDSEDLNTTIDQMLAFVNRKGSVTAGEISKEFKLPSHVVEKYAQSLEDYGLLNIEYGMLGGMVLKKLE